MKNANARSKRANEDLSLSKMAGEIDRGLQEIRQILRRPVESAFAQGNLTGPQRNVMRAVFHSNGIGIKELSRSVGLAHSTVSGIVDRLEERGMLTRSTDEKDARAVKIEVSSEVRNFMRNKLPQLTIHPLSAALKKMTRAERRKVASALRALRFALDESVH